MKHIITLLIIGSLICSCVAVVKKPTLYKIVFIEEDGTEKLHFRQSYPLCSDWVGWGGQCYEILNGIEIVYSKEYPRATAEDTIEAPAQVYESPPDLCKEPRQPDEQPTCNISKPTAYDTTIFGVTLGKSLCESGMRECEVNWDCDRYDGYYSRGYKVDDTGCYQHGYSLVHVIQDLSYRNQITVLSPDEVRGILMSFHTDNYFSVKKSLISKFGKPSSCDVSTLQNAHGAKYNSQNCIWITKGGDSINLYQRNNKVDEGFLQVASKEAIQDTKIRREQVQRNNTSKF